MFSSLSLIVSARPRAPSSQRGSARSSRGQSHDGDLCTHIVTKVNTPLLFEGYLRYTNRDISWYLVRCTHCSAFLRRPLTQISARCLLAYVWASTRARPSSGTRFAVRSLQTTRYASPGFPVEYIRVGRVTCYIPAYPRHDASGLPFATLDRTRGHAHC